MKKATCVVNVKGGVGKTLVAINVAKQLTLMGRVALIDADLDNSSFSQFTGIDGVIQIDKKQRFKPFVWEGMEVFSMSLVTSRDQSVSMSGDRYVQIIDDVITRSDWDAEYFVFDLPGGSSDIFRSVISVLGDELVGNVIVHQPAMVDSTRKILNLHRYLEIPVLGIIENMSYMKQGAVTLHPFGKSTVKEIAKEFSVKVLGKIPLDPSIAEGFSNGNPFLPRKLMKPIIDTCKVIVESPVIKPGFLQRAKDKITSVVKGEVEKVMAGLIISTGKAFDFQTMRRKTGFTEERPVLLVITDQSGETEITRVGIRVTSNGVKIIAEPKREEDYPRWISQFDFQIVLDFKTLARILMGKIKKGKDERAFSTWDAWCNGDLKAYGLGYAPRAVNAIRSIFDNEEVIRPIREQYGAILMRWI